MRQLAAWGSLFLAATLCGCTTVAPVREASVGSAVDAFDAEAAVAAIRAAGTANASELDIQPLRDPQVEDLRQQAAALQTRRMFLAAAELLDDALALNADDPAILQERAEAALLLHQLPAAERLARRAFAAGSQVGPLCRRHWEAIAQVRGALAAAPGAGAAVTDAADAIDARRQRDACTVAAPERF